MNRSLLGTWVLLLVLAALASCGDPAPPAAAPSIWKKPNSGSTFTYDLWRTDSNGVRIAISHSSYPDRVLSHDTTIHGASGGLLIDHIGFDELLYDYRSDDDLAVALVGRGGIRHPWIVYPVGTKTPKTHPQETVAGSFPTIVVRGSTTTYLGTDTISTDAGMFHTHRILHSANDTTTDGIAFTTADTIWFAPSLGTYVRKSNPPYPVAKREGLQVLLRNYVLR